MIERIIREHKLLENVNAAGTVLMDGLKRLEKIYPKLLLNPRGLGKATGRKKSTQGGEKRKLVMLVHAHELALLRVRLCCSDWMLSFACLLPCVCDCCMCRYFSCFRSSFCLPPRSSRESYACEGSADERLWKSFDSTSSDAHLPTEACKHLFEHSGRSAEGDEIERKEYTQTDEIEREECIHTAEHSKKRRTHRFY